VRTASTGSSRSRITIKGSAKQPACLERELVEQRKSAGQQRMHLGVSYNTGCGKINGKMKRGIGRIRPIGVSMAHALNSFNRREHRGHRERQKLLLFSSFLRALCVLCGESSSFSLVTELNSVTSPSLKLCFTALDCGLRYPKFWRIRRRRGDGGFAKCNFAGWVRYEVQLRNEEKMGSDRKSVV
jgi:hypothetical protein